MLIVARDLSEPLTSLVKKIDAKVNEAAPKYHGSQNARLGAYLIVPVSQGKEQQLQSLGAREAIKRVSLCIGALPPRYEINPDVDVTVIIYSPGRRGNPVTANFALRTFELDQARSDAIVAALGNVLPK